MLTWSYTLAAKLYIATIPWADCLKASAIAVPPGPANSAAFVAFCARSPQGENPPTDAAPVPLDARILGAAFGGWKCQANNPAPFGGSWVPGPTAAGVEFFGLTGVANPVATRDNINANGSFGMVVSGRPNAVFEPGFQVMRPRLRAQIWDRVTGDIACGTDNRGQPTATVALNATFTKFPSHKIWAHSPAAAAPVLIFANPQKSFSNLWFLPAVGAP